MKMKLMRFSYNIVHVPGKELHTADTLSRAPVTETTEGTLNEEVEAFVNVVLCMRCLPPINE